MKRKEIFKNIRNYKNLTKEELVSTLKNFNELVYSNYSQLQIDNGNIDSDMELLSSSLESYELVKFNDNINWVITLDNYDISEWSKEEKLNKIMEYVNNDMVILDILEPKYNNIEHKIIEKLVENKVVYYIGHENTEDENGKYCGYYLVMYKGNQLDLFINEEDNSLSIIGNVQQDVDERVEDITYDKVLKTLEQIKEYKGE